MNEETFGIDEFTSLVDLTAAAWTAGRGRDWSVPAGTLEWTCLETADHAVDTVIAPALFLASRRTDRYPEIAWNLRMGESATPALLVEALEIASRLLTSTVLAAGPDVRAIIWRRPEPATRPARDFLPRAGLELAIHAHDVCLGLQIPFEPPAEVSLRLREHTRDWPTWKIRHGLGDTDDPWADLLEGYDRMRAAPN